MIQDTRIQRLNDREEQVKRPYVVYWMQAAQRAHVNHALEFAAGEAERLKKPLLVYFGLTERFPEGNLRAYRFMLEGLVEVKEALHRRGVKLVVLHTPPPVGAVEVGAYAALMVTDRGYLRVEKTWRDSAAALLDCPLYQVETNVLVPVEVVSGKEEYSAATIRKKIHLQMEHYGVPLAERRMSYHSRGDVLPFAEFPLEPLDGALAKLELDRTVPPSPLFLGGTSKALSLLHAFLEEKLQDYDQVRNDPAGKGTSDLSPYLHFGQIAPLHIYLETLKKPTQLRGGFLEELIVRRELSMNYVHYNPFYEDYQALPDWAKKTLEAHRADPRPVLHTLEELEEGRTYDPYWNAAQREMVLTGKMQGYMRMYWGKKILEWMRTPEEAFQAALYLNNKYELDGRDANGFTGVAWCFGKHDRPWQERPIFGMVRYMNDKGLERKFRMQAYLDKVAALEAAYGDPGGEGERKG